MRFDKAANARSPIVRLTAGHIAVEFHWRHDRWQHEVRSPDGRVWMSVEGVSGDGGDPRWPRSPVLTEVSLVDVAGRPAALGIGLAGRSHFSLCVTEHPDLDDTLLFEAACRINAPAAWIGSTYTDGDGSTIGIEPAGVAAVPPATVCWTYTCGPDGPRPRPPSVCRAAGG